VCEGVGVLNDEQLIRSGRIDVRGAAFCKIEKVIKLKAERGTSRWLQTFVGGECGEGIGEMG
jgi:hypothetical protein